MDKGVFDQRGAKALKPHGSQPGVLYGLCKVHKVTSEGIPPFIPIPSAINTPAYRLLSSLTKNKFVLKNSFELAANIREQNADLFMASFDIDSLLAN